MEHSHYHSEHHHNKKEEKLFFADEHRFHCFLHTHNGAVVLSFQIDFYGALMTAESKLKELFSALSCYIAEQNGIIGHMKAHGKEWRASLRISCTNGVTESERQEEMQTEMNGTAIVFQIDDQDFLTVFKENAIKIFRNEERILNNDECKRKLSYGRSGT